MSQAHQYQNEPRTPQHFSIFPTTLCCCLILQPFVDTPQNSSHLPLRETERPLSSSTLPSQQGCMSHNLCCPKTQQPCRLSFYCPSQCHLGGRPDQSFQHENNQTHCKCLHF